jgi:hypothetical protein
MSTSIFYLNRYNRFVESYKRNLIIKDGYYEKHHIVPKCLGGTDDIENLVLLPARAHFIAHALLHKAHPEHRGLAHAFAMMAVNNSGQRRHSSARLYELSKVARSAALKGIPRPEWVKEKLRKPKLNKQNYSGPKSEEHKLKIGLAHKGKSKNPESVRKSVEAKAGYFSRIKQDTFAKTELLREDFIASGLTRTEFAIARGIPYNTLKKYITGL